MAKKPRTMACPTCRKTVKTTDEHFPFCSERCRSIDLGKWASGAYRISSPILDPEVLEQVERRTDGSEDDSEGEERKRS